VDEKTPSWGIQPVPDRLRVLGLLDLTLLWGNLSVSLLVIVAAAGLVPMLSFKEALLAILIGSLAGSLLLGLAGAIGADARVPGMVLLRAPLGRRGSYAPTVLNVAQNLGWSTFELIIISTAAAALSERVFGFEARWLWALVFGAVSLALGLMGPIGFVRRYVRKFAVWAVVASIAYLTWWAIDKADLHELWQTSGEGGLSVGQGIDLVMASVVSWTPLAADYTRFGRGRRSAFIGAGVGYLLPTLWGFALGAVLVLERGLSDPAQIPSAVASGSVLAVIALLMLTVDDRHRRRDRDRPRQLPDLPVPARLGVRAALRRAARRLARPWGALRPGGHLRGAARALGAARGVGDRLRAVPVALAGRPVVVDRPRRAPRPRPRATDGLAAELCGRLRPDAARGLGRFAACGRSQSSGTSRATSLTASRGRAAHRCTPRGRCACWGALR
jgi:Permease for cytosine/purines, uracil, thiamine, allantoin